MTTFTLTNAQAMSIATFAIATDPKNAGGVIGCVKLSLSNGLVTVTATNRYIIARQTFETNYPDTLDVMLSPEALKLMKTAKYGVDISIDGDDLIIKNGSQTFSEVMVSPNRFPDVEGMLANAEETNKPVTAMALNFDLLVKIAKLKSSTDSKSDNSFNVYCQGETETAKPKAILLQRNNLKVLVQPMLPIKNNY